MSKNKMASVVIGAIFIVLALLPLLGRQERVARQQPPPPIQRPAPPAPPAQPARIAPPPQPVYTPPPQTEGVIEQAYRRHASRVPVVESGVVSRLLSDDNQGARHQRFILRLNSGHTILIAHNIDIAPRLNNLSQGDTVSFSGLYEWNDQGGVVHWTHRDPSGRYSGGYLYHNGRQYK